MPILNMDTDIADNSQTKIMTVEQELVGKVQDLSKSIEELRSTWQGNSASEFLQEYDQWQKTVTDMCGTLRELGVSLKNEIDQWKATASRLE